MISTAAADAPAVTPPRARHRRRAFSEQRPLRRTAWVAFGAQFVVMAVWSNLQYSRFALTKDATTYIQALHLLSRGQLNPFSTSLGYSFVRDHFELLAWPLALLDRIGPHGLMVLWGQDLFVVLAEAAAFSWMRHVVVSRPVVDGTRVTPVQLLGLGLVLLIANPWSYWAIAYDIHIETFAALFVVMAAFEFSRGRSRRAWIWVGLTVLSGDVPTTWILGLGLSALVAARGTGGTRWSRYRTGVLLIVASLAWLGFIGLIGGNRGSTFIANYGYLAVAAGAAVPTHMGLFELVKGVIRHPTNVLDAFWHKGLNIYAHVLPSGGIGLFTAWTFGVPLVVIAQTTLTHRTLYSFEPFQNIPMGLFVSVGTVVALSWLTNRYHVARAASMSVLGLFGALALAWGAVWIPEAVPNWLRVSSAQAAELSSALSRIPPDAEVAVQQGIAGPFANRQHVYFLGGLRHEIPVSGTWVWFIVAPSVGIELTPVTDAMSILDQLAGPVGAQLEVHGDGVWAFRWRRPSSVHRLRIEPASDAIGAWTVPSTAGTLSLSGPPSDWHVRSTGAPGYLVEGDYWTRPAGAYEARVTFKSSSRLNVEVWNATANTLLARRSVLPSQSKIDAVLRFRFPKVLPPAGAYSGVGPLRVDRAPPPLKADDLEIRVWTPGGATAEVYRVSLLGPRGM